jgi:hypothetical protein
MCDGCCTGKVITIDEDAYPNLSSMVDPGKYMNPNCDMELLYVGDRIAKDV